MIELVVSGSNRQTFSLKDVQKLPWHVAWACDMAHKKPWCPSLISPQISPQPHKVLSRCVLCADLNPQCKNMWPQCGRWCQKVSKSCKTMVVPTNFKHNPIFYVCKIVIKNQHQLQENCDEIDLIYVSFTLHFACAPRCVLHMIS